MADHTIHYPRPGFGYVRALSQQEELPLLRDHLLRLDPESRVAFAHDRDLLLGRDRAATGDDRAQTRHGRQPIGPARLA